VIPRHQKVIFTVLLLASLAMAGVLWELRQRAHQRLIAGEDGAPTAAPQVAPAEQATLLVANDADNSLLAQVRSLPLPSDPGSRARAILGKLLDLYATADSTHPVSGGATSIAQVFLLPAETTRTPAAVRPGTASPRAKTLEGASRQQDGPQLAIVNLTSSFVASHPSGLETETLTVISICGTLHANLPQVTEVRFLVDGQQHSTLAGHADLTRTYLAADAVPTEGVHP
jgi:hypothetical protein